MILAGRHRLRLGLQGGREELGVVSGDMPTNEGLSSYHWEHSNCGFIVSLLIRLTVFMQSIFSRWYLVMNCRNHFFSLPFSMRRQRHVWRLNTRFLRRRSHWRFMIGRRRRVLGLSTVKRLVSVIRRRSVLGALRPFILSMERYRFRLLPSKPERPPAFITLWSTPFGCLLVQTLVVIFVTFCIFDALCICGVQVIDLSVIRLYFVWLNV